MKEQLTMFSLGDRLGYVRNSRVLQDYCKANAGLKLIVGYSIYNKKFREGGVWVLLFDFRGYIAILFKLKYAK